MSHIIYNTSEPDVICVIYTFNNSPKHQNTLISILLTIPYKLDRSPVFLIILKCKFIDVFKVQTDNRIFEIIPTSCI